MKTIMVRYKTHPHAAEENAALARAVYAELHEKGRPGLRYTTYRLPDGVSFVHFATHDGDSTLLTSMPAFKAFVANIKERCEEQPVSVELSTVGAYDFSAPGGAAA
jgi:hypothetical protein